MFNIIKRWKISYWFCWSIIIYDKKTFKPDFKIKEHDGCINCLIQLKSGILASCSYDNTIKLYNIKEKEYQVIQTLKYHTNSVN